MHNPTVSRRGPRSVAQLLAVLVAVPAVLLGLPAMLIAVADRRFGHVSPVHGVNAPWRWSFDDLRSWGMRLTDGLDSSVALVDIFFRVGLVVGWLCAVVLIYTVVDEMVFQLRHGMPSRRRHLGVLGSLGRKLATALIAVLPLVVSAAPALAGSHVSSPASGVVHQRTADLPEPSTTVVTLPAAGASAASSALGVGWSVLEVQRGDSVWAIAQRIADQSDGGVDVAAIAQQIVGANLGTVMGDGHRFSTPALIEPGWLLKVPFASSSPAPTVATSSTATVAADETYVVVAGDSYWGIAEHHLDPHAAGADIATFTRELIVLNAPVLGYEDERLIRPGDVIHLGAPPVVAELPAPGADATPINVAPIVVAALPPVVAPDPTSTSIVDPVALPVSIAASGDTPATPLVVDPAVAQAARDLSNNGVPVQRGLAAAVLLSGGVIAALGTRRRQQLRTAAVGARLLAPTSSAVETELLLRSLTPGDLLARIDLAVRSAAADLARQQARIVAVEAGDDGEIRLYTDRPAVTVARHFALDIDAGAWRLPAAVTLADLADVALGTNQPCPAILHIGASAGGQLFVDLEAIGILSIDADPVVAASIVRCAAASLAVSPFAESTRVFTVGIEIEANLGSPNVESYDSLGSAVAAVRSTVGSIGAATTDAVSTFALRAAARGGEAWEPSLLLAVGSADPEDLGLLTGLAGGGGRGVGVLVDRPVVGSGAVLRAIDGEFILEPLGRRVNLVGLSTEEVVAVDELLDAAERPLVAASALSGGAVVHSPTTPFAGFTDRAAELFVQVLGPVAVHAGDDQPIVFDRSKAQELVVWLSQHRHRPTRTAARTALWDLTVRDATFSNVVSDARRATAKAVTPPVGQEWIGRTMNEDLPLHDLVVSDAELLAGRVEAAHGLSPADAIAVLRPGVALIHGMPFADTSYLWPDAEGITSSLVLLATSAAGELAAHYLSTGDVDGVFWATGKGLKVLAGHEELIALRMRAHALRGDLAGVRSEWDSYERAVHADSWASAEPSPKLVDLRRALLAPSLAS